VILAEEHPRFDEPDPPLVQQSTRLSWSSISRRRNWPHYTFLAARPRRRGDQNDGHRMAALGHKRSLERQTDRNLLFDVNVTRSRITIHLTVNTACSPILIRNARLARDRARFAQSASQPHEQFLERRSSPMAELETSEMLLEHQPHGTIRRSSSNRCRIRRAQLPQRQRRARLRCYCFP
jgi:hypothetical protein